MGVLRQACGELLVAEDALDRGLGVVEVALDRAYVHVGTGLRGHLQFLHLADLAFGVEDGDAGSGRIRKSCEGGLAGVSGCGGDDHDLLVVVAVGRGGTCHEAGEDLERDILECGGRAVEQFHHVVVAKRLDRGDLLVGPLFAVCFGDALGKLLFGEVGQQCAEYALGDGLIGHAGKIVDGDLGFAELIGDEQTAVVGESEANGLLGSE